jgi:protein-tyrosine phosphatase
MGAMAELHWSGCENVRDLGGLPLRRGGTVAERSLVRADSLTRLDEAGLAAARAYGVGLVIDLRGETETASPVHPFVGSPAYVNVPWVDVPLDDGARLVDFYLGSVDVNHGQVAQVLRAFVAAPQGPVVVHCAAGKDRTGIIVSLLLSLAGVPRGSVVADYAHSEVALGYAALLETLDEEHQALAREYARSAPETISAFLDRIDQLGGVERYLVERCGLDADEVDAVRRRLVEPL